MRGMLLFTAVLTAAPIALAAPPQPMRDLVHADAATLDALYASGTVGPLPTGYFPGLAIPDPGSPSTPRKSRTIGLLWKGKVFHGDGTGKNRVLGMNAVPVKVYEGTSWRDGGPAIIVDYSESWRMFRGVRDEIREISPGLYLGLTYVQKPSGPQQTTMFTLQSPTP